MFCRQGEENLYLLAVLSFFILCGVFSGCPLCNPGKNEAIEGTGGLFHPTVDLVAVHKDIPSAALSLLDRLKLQCFQMSEISPKSHEICQWHIFVRLQVHQLMKGIDKSPRKRALCIVCKSTVHHDPALL